MSELRDNSRNAAAPLGAPNWLRTIFPRNLALTLSALLSTDIRVRLDTAGSSTRGCVEAEVDDRRRCYALQPSSVEEASDEVIVHFSPSLAFFVVERLMGGTGQPGDVPKRPLTRIERDALGRVAEMLGVALSASRGSEATMTAATAPPQSAEDPTAPILLANFQVASRGEVYPFSLCLPAGTATVAEQPATNGGPLEVTVDIETHLSDEELANLAPGDIVVTDTRQDGLVTVRVAGIPKFVARLGAADGHRAVAIRGKVKPDSRS